MRYIVAWSDLGHLQRVIPIAAAHVANGHPPFGPQIGEHQGAAFLLLAVIPCQPRSPLVMHRLGNQSALVIRERLGELSLCSFGGWDFVFLSGDQRR